MSSTRRMPSGSPASCTRACSTPMSLLTRSPLITSPASSRSARAGVEFTLLRNGLYTEGYTGHLREYLTSGEIPGAAANGRISAATRQDFASAAAAALLRTEGGNPTYELGGPSFDLAQLARTISDVTGTRVTYRDLPVEQYVDVLQQDGLDQATARFVAAIEASIARGELETNRQR